MPHRVGAEIKTHGGQKICALDLVTGLEAGGNRGNCPFDPPCEGLVHPADFKVVLESLTQAMVDVAEPGKTVEEYKKRVYENFYTEFYKEHPEFRVVPAAAAVGAAAAAAAEPAVVGAVEAAAPAGVGAVEAAAPGQVGGAEPIINLINPMMDGICELPPKGARRGTYRKKNKGKTQKHRR
jgi:hypothetical protein